MDIASQSTKSLASQAIEIFHTNIQEGYSRWKQEPYRFISPSKKEYIYQWQWDTAFHAIVLSQLDPEWAKEEIRSYLKGQHENGFLPHVIFWQERKPLPHWAYIESNPWTPRIHTTAITQPPVTAIAIEIMHQRHPDTTFLAEVLPKIAKHHQWLMDNRDPDHDNLLAIISPNESGMDELPVFQVVMGYQGNDTARLHYAFRKADLLNQLYLYNNRRILDHDHFNVEETLFNCVFAEANRSLARLLKEIGQNEQSTQFSTLADKVEKSILSKMWDDKDKIFYSLFSKQEQMAKVKTIASLMPLYLDGIPKEQRDQLVNLHLLNPNEFWTKYPIPSVAKDEPYYTPGDTPAYQIKLLWRGPTWISTNWFIVKGLRKHGYDDLADHIVDQTLSMIQQQGFREYYNPETGEGYRRKNFGWSTLIIDLLSNKDK
jgi:glycogen debranching enzyme